MKQKFTALLILFAVLINIGAVSAFADAVPTVTVEDVMAKPGEEINVNIILENNTGFANLNIEVGYDPDVMTLTNAESAPEVGGTYTPAKDDAVNPYNMSWDSATNIYHNEPLATLTFLIKKDAEDGVYPITINYYKGRNGDYEDGVSVNFDENEKPLGLQYVNGCVTIKRNKIIACKDGNSINITLEGKDKNTGIVYAAIYKVLDNGNEDVKEYVVLAARYHVSKDETEPFEEVETGTYAKIMWWDEDGKPMCPSEKVEFTEN